MPVAAGCGARRAGIRNRIPSTSQELVQRVHWTVYTGSRERAEYSGWK